MNQLLADIRYAWRQLRRAPGFAITAVLTLALGIGANSTILSWISATLFNPIPAAKNVDRMLALQRGERSEHPTPPFSYPDFVDLRANTKTFSGLIGYHDDYISITGSAKPERIYGALTSADFFEVLGVQPILGTSLISSRNNERAGAPVAVLSYSLWQKRFGGDQSVIGKTIQLNLHPYTIVGVSPKGFRGCKSGLRADIFLPLGVDRQIWDGDRINNRGLNWINVLGMLQPGVDPHQADNCIRRITAERTRSRAIRCGARRSVPTSTWPAPCPSCWRWPPCFYCWPAPTLPTCCWSVRWPAGASSPSACRWAPGAGLSFASSCWRTC
jgi:hypothetical protein